MGRPAKWERAVPVKTLTAAMIKTRMRWLCCSRKPAWASRRVRKLERKRVTVRVRKVSSEKRAESFPGRSLFLSMAVHRLVA